ncbi:MAG: vitamin B12-dependent ribonucleotide reductase [Nanoarchaeota archaeon]
MVEIEYNQQEHIKLEDALGIVNKERLSNYIQSGLITKHSYKGIEFINRLDLGRAEYLNNEKLNKKNIKVNRYFTDGKTDPFESVGKYERKIIDIKNINGEIIFQFEGIFPKSWDANSRKAASNKYFFKPEKSDWGKKIGEKIGKEYEFSPNHLFGRVSKFFSEWGLKLGYFQEEEAKIFEDELNFLQINQMFAFNSPVYFNAGLYEAYGIIGSPGINYTRDIKTGKIIKIDDGCYIRPQCHACFIKGPKDNLESLLKHSLTEGGVFSNGSGIGQDLSVIRAAGEPLSSGGIASGPMSYLVYYDDLASSIKSGGKNRRAARMSTLKYWHPDSLKFIRSKVREDYKALLLMKAGLGPGFEGEAYSTVKFQNTNLSVRLDDHFFEQLERGGEIELMYIRSGKIAGKVSAEQILKEIAFGSWRIGDPSVQYESKIQEMHTCKNSGPINSSNPCSEYMFLDNTSCNLGSHNLLKYADIKSKIDIDKFLYAIYITQIALDIANDAASYPDPDIAKISPEFRTTGLGYANLGALLMRNGLAYDSDKGRALAATLTAILTGKAYETSADLAEALGPFVHYELNKKPMLEVIEKHRKALDNIQFDCLEERLKTVAYEVWDNALEKGRKFGFRNANTTVIAPTGTIGILMGCDTTGIEPVTGLIIKKNIAGGGSLDLDIQEIPNALRNLRYDEEQIKDIVNYIREKGIVDGAPHLSQNDYAVFETAFSPNKNGKTISFEGHIKMLGATQPFVSGAISKTNNLPENATVKDLYDGYILGYKLGLKALSAFRYNSKPVSILTFGEKNLYKELRRGEKRELPTTRESFESEVEIDGVPIHIVVSEYEDGTPGQIVFLSYKAGSTLKALLENNGILASKSLKRGLPLESIVDSWIGQKFEPSGLVVGDPWIKTTLSPLDYAAKFLSLQYLGNLEVADNKEGLNLFLLRGYKNGAFDTYKKQKIDSWNYEEVINNQELGGFVKSSEEQVPKVSESDKNKLTKNLRGVICIDCGNLMRQTSPGCWECPNCLNKRGGCGQ